MSEYQYYEFLAIDRSLDQLEIAALRRLSSRAEITPTQFTNVYHWGDFKGSPKQLMEKYFDAHVYVANWGVHHLILRLPQGSVDENLVALYVSNEGLDFWTTGEHLIIQWQCDDEPDDGWVEGEGWMARLALIREELERGDYRALYLGWLSGLRLDDRAENAIEPPVPAGLHSPTAAQHALAKFLNIDEDLLTAAAEASPESPAPADSAHEMAQWISDIPIDEARQYLLLLLQGKSRHAEQQIRRKYTASLRSSSSEPIVSAPKRRSVGELQKLVEQAQRERRTREEENRQRELAKRRQEREQYLATLAEDFERHWLSVHQLAEQQTSSAYDRACDLLVDLSEAYPLAHRRDEFLEKLRQFRAIYARRSALLRRLDKAGIK